MIKKFTILILLIYFKGISQETQIVHIDRFDNDKNDWGITDTNKWLCKIDNGKLLIENRLDDIWVYFDAENIKNLPNRAYSEISFDFNITQEDLENGGAGLAFINDMNSKEFESVYLIIQKDISYLSKLSNSYSEGGFTLNGSSKTPKLQSTNVVKIVLDNQQKSTKSASTKVYINGVLTLESEWNISNFNKIGLISYGQHKTYYDNFVVKQSTELNYVEDAFDYIFIDNQQLIDHNGIETTSLTKYIPIEIVDNQNILSTKDLIKSLKKNNKCSSIETKKVDFNGKKREMFSFNYGNSLIEFFTDTEKPNPIQINFLEKDDLDNFFKIYSDYNSYRNTDKDKSQWASNPWFSILRFDDSFRATIWRGM
ncbi:hypothetical protein [Algibacter pectinivorans]|uniref:Uncharacterized protein n=1 Tax=Algibacter pectinivorans TaxID=870482 RepID=A0A1I1SD38_9FLAO|nr:hypothetical protein [Algibacter pectinivorans]SFD41773.1 hypothetical protein SAMN04487987_11331 [Algibacter pectinivorans]